MSDSEDAKGKSRSRSKSRSRGDQTSSDTKENNNNNNNKNNGEQSGTDSATKKDRKYALYWDEADDPRYEKKEITPEEYEHRRWVLLRSTEDAIKMTRDGQGYLLKCGLNIIFFLLSC